ncbi:ligase-associated DNA damage response DEXH box helicase [Cesiribacter sp. SM1]|uniref:ligase-associated DNA damage response DEXH box helicase n=1 Tax=Cesiribacter sp. SM1 TaxID=2861196 RepID=UPI001CD51B78|nr:ligase-associated DNA damage response DEXH box helicase [Cesiribacter sp. SM1]
MKSIINSSTVPDLRVAQSWFKSRGWQPFPFQEEVWTAYLQGQSGLLNAPTGSGKTYALWWALLLEWINENPDNWQSKRPGGLQLVWITPLRALARDLQLAMQQVVDELGMSWKVSLRTGDTSSSERQKQLRSSQECIITTPESLHLLLSQKTSSQLFKRFRCLVVDEWHELLGSKRGVQTELAITRLRKINSLQPKTWGISATIGNLQEAMEILVGKQEAKQAKLVRAQVDKKIEIASIIPEEVESLPWAGHMGLKLLPYILPIIENSTSTLLFTNTRAQTELWYQKLMEYAPQMAGLVALHHGSLDREVRDWVEDALHSGRLKLVICTSSLDLGVDFKPVQTVIQVGSPKGIARFMQRAGRSGHQPGATSKIHFLPTNGLELLEAAALKKALATAHCESRVPLQKPMDVLVQYLVTMAVGEGFREDELYEEVKASWSYSTLNQEEWRWALEFVTSGGSTLDQYEEYNKVAKDEEGYYRVPSKRIALRHRLSMGTIVSDPTLRIKFISGGYIGQIEESFISRLKKGDVFWFAGRALQFEQIKDMTVLVRRSKSKKGVVPRWSGSRLSLSSTMSSLIREVISEAANGLNTEPEVLAVEPILGLQSRLSGIPQLHQLLIESFRSPDGYHAVFYPFEGRNVHELLAALTAYRISRLQPLSFSLAMNDYGFELLSDTPIPLEEALSEDLFSAEILLDDIRESINSTEMARRRFREIAAIAGLVFTGYPGKPVSNKHLQANSSIIYDVLQEYDPQNLLLEQASREVLQVQLEQDRFLKALQRINAQEIVLLRPARPTPFAFPIMVDRLREHISSEDLESRIAKMQLQLEQWAGKQGFL